MELVFCCDGFVDVAALTMDTDDNGDDDVQKIRKTTDIDTRTINGVPERLPVVHSEKSVETEIMNCLQPIPED